VKDQRPRCVVIGRASPRFILAHTDRETAVAVAREVATPPGNRPVAAVATRKRKHAVTFFFANGDERDT
jgi:hypothetical protein